MNILNARQTAEKLPFDSLVLAVETAARELAQGRLLAPERLVTPVGEGGVLLCMPAIGGDIGVTKLITVHGNNPAIGLPAIQGDVIVFEAKTGRRLLMLDGPTVTARRTAAVTLLGVRKLAPRPPASAILIGTGVQAWAHAEALAAYFGVRRFWVVARDAGKTASFCQNLQEAIPGTEVTPMAAKEMALGLPSADLMVALTNSRTPVIPENLPRDMMVVGVGAFKPDMAEFPPALLAARQIVVDDLAGARHEAGDLLQANVDWSRVLPLSGVLDGHLAGQMPVPVFKTVGQAAWDLAAARVALQQSGPGAA